MDLFKCYERIEELLLKVAELEADKNNLAAENERLHAGFLECMSTLKSLPPTVQDENCILDKDQMGELIYNMTLKRLQERYNRLTKESYHVDSLAVFENWLLSEESFDECYIEISSHKTISGHAEILDW